MKNKFLIIMITLIVILSFIVIIFNTDKDQYLKEITYNELQEKINKKESFPLLIMSTSCTHCQSFEPKYKSVLNKYELTSYYINIANLNEDDYNGLEDLTSFEGTPTVVFIKNGSLMKIEINGDKDKDLVISKFQRAGFIEK